MAWAAAPSFGRAIKAPAPRARGAGGFPRVVVVGAGIAGLNATYVLKKAGVPATLYSADRRVGGRILSFNGLVGQGLTTEMGGEFIDSNHFEILALASEFGFDLLDSSNDPLASTYYFGGRHYADAQLLPELVPLAARFQQDLSTVPANVSYLNRNPQAVYLDRTNLGDYLARTGAAWPSTSS